VISISLILLNFFLLFISIFLVNRIKLANSTFSIKTKVFIILAFLLYSSLFLIFFHLNPSLDFELFSSFIKDSFFYASQLNFCNSKSIDIPITTWSVFSIYRSLIPFWYDLFGSLDSLSIIFLFMSHLVSFMVIAFSSVYFDFNNLNTNLKSLNSFKLTLNSVLVMTLMMDLLFITNNLLIIFFLAELSLIPLSFLMVKDTTVFWRKFKFESLYENKRPLALYYLIFFTIASGGFGFVGIAVIYFLFGTVSLSTLTSFEATNLEFLSALFSDLNTNTFNSFSLSNIALLFSLLCLVFWISVKVPLAPVHIWLPKAHVEGSTESSMLLAGVILKVTVYVLLRLSSIPAYTLLLDQYRPFLLSIAATTAVLGAFGSLLTTDMKKITAYSSVSHMGIILSAGFYMCSLSISVAPFLILLLTHTVVSTAMFMMIGCIYKSRYGVFVSRNRLTYGGLLFSFPVYFLFGAIIFSNLNVPLTMGFVGELGVLITVVKSGLTFGIILSVASFILLLPMLAMLGQVLLGPIRLVDFFKLGSPFPSNLGVDVFIKRLVFNKLIWDQPFLNFYLVNRIYFSSIFLIILGFGIFSFLFIDFLESSLIMFDLILLKIASF
jgi:NADH:ubiquinone oxidoreductase subunit 4 (subunit M)